MLLADVPFETLGLHSSTTKCNQSHLIIEAKRVGCDGVVEGRPDDNDDGGVIEDDELDV